MRLLREVLRFILHFMVDEWEFAIDLNALLKKRIVSIKVGLSPSKKKLYYLLDWKPVKNDEKYFLFDLKSSFRSPHIFKFLSRLFGRRKNGLIKVILH